MSVLSLQIKELREKAHQFEGYQNGEISRMLRKAADTIEGLRERLQDAVLGRGECEMISFPIDQYNFGWKCSECGHTTLDSRPAFCGGCGRKVS